jgi:hypothetical protein
MNRAFDYNGTIVAGSRPTKTLRTLKKVLTIDSADRDTSKFLTNGDFVVYLPRVYENIVSLRLMSAEFPLLTPQGAYTGGAVMHSYANGQNIPGNIDGFTGDTGPASPYPYYFLIELDGLNKSDETAVGANKSTFTDSFFAKIPVLANTVYDNHLQFLEYNDHSGIENIARYSPPIGKLDRLRIRTRLHSQQGNQGFIYWTADGNYMNVENTILDYTLSLEIEYLDNGFDDYSTTETRIHN